MEQNRKDKTKNRSLAFNTIALVTLAIAVLVVIFANVIFTNVLPWQLDLTENQDFSMSAEAKEVLKDIDKEVEIVGLFDEVKKDLGTPNSTESSYLTDMYLTGQLNVDTQFGAMYDAYTLPQVVGVKTSLSYMSVDSVMGILAEFEQTNSNISVSYVDPVDNPWFLTDYLGDSERADEFEKGDFIVKCGNVFKRVTSVELCRTVISTATGNKLYYPYAPNVDGGFLSAILYVTAEERPLIGVSTNHGEISLDDYFTVLQSSLKDNVFDLKTFDMATEKNFSQYDIILMVDPVADITVGEADDLKKYLSNGGNLMLMADPKTEGVGGLAFTNLNGVLEFFNLTINNDFVKSENTKELTANGYLVESIIISNQGPLMEVLENSYQVQIPAARSISYLSKTSGGLDVGMVVRTSDQAYTIDYSTGKQSGQGSKCLVAVAEDTTALEGGKVFVAGSAAMFADGCATVGSSVDMLARVCTWMEESINYKLPVKTYTAAAITVTESQATIWGIVFVAVLPLLTFAIGIVIWLRRRHL